MGPTDRAETIHAPERETQPRTRSQHETEPEERNTLVSTPVARKRDRTDMTQHATASKNRTRVWQSGRAYKRGATLKPHCQVPRGKNCSKWSCYVCGMQVCPGCKRNANDACAGFHKTRRSDEPPNTNMELDATWLDTSTYPDTVRDTQSAK